MAITPKLEIKQSQSLLMTPQLRQAINLLQMSNLELNTLIDEELAANPLLQKEEANAGDEADLPQTIDDYDTDETPSLLEEDFTPDFDLADRFDDSGSDNEGYNSLENDYDWNQSGRSKNNFDDEDFDFFEKKLAQTPSLYEVLTEQIGLTFKSPKDRFIARRLCEYLDEAGYFRGDVKQIAAQLKISEAQVGKVLDGLKQFEPSGLFAQDLSECLKLQLRAQGITESKIFLLLDNLPLLAERRFKELKKICDCDDEALNDYIRLIKSLNPKPAADYHVETAATVIPDVFVKRDKYGIYHVELNSASLPRLLINQHYYSEIKNADKTTKRYLKENLNSAGFLIKSLHQRAMSILKVCEEIVKYQYDFFEKGIDHLKPMALKDIADAVELHESTVSRATVNKYMHTPLGIFELKYFFSAAAGSYSGDENQSTTAIKHKIKQMIENEDPKKVLSDDKISELLAREGLKVARRTVAKYRESMKIAPSSERKREKRKI